MSNLIIVFFIWIFSFLGMFFIFLRKIPLILSFEPQKESLFSILKKKIENLNPLKNFSFEIFLQKWIAKIRILILKIDNLTFKWLRELKEKQKKKIDDYWEKIKKEIKK
jgi:hypothetical protein